jgi:hypothetical protein
VTGGGTVGVAVVAAAVTPGPRVVGAATVVNGEETSVVGVATDEVGADEAVPSSSFELQATSEATATEKASIDLVGERTPGT